MRLEAMVSNSCCKLALCTPSISQQVKSCSIGPAAEYQSPHSRGSIGSHSGQL